MRTQTFIVSMASALVFAGAAQATVAPGFASIDSFGIADAISPYAGMPSLLGGYNYSPGSDSQQATPTPSAYGAATSRDLMGGWKTITTAGYAKGSNSVGTNAMTMSYGGAANSSGKWFNSASNTPDPLSFTAQALTYYSNQTSTAVWGAFSADPSSAFGGSINMSGITAFSFDLSGYAKTGSNNTAKMYLRVLSIQANGDTTLGNYDVALSNGHVDVAAANFGAQDWSAIYQIEMVFTNTTIVSNVAQVAPTGTVTVSNFGYLAPVPAPGAAALIGLAGLVASRRRRN